MANHKSAEKRARQTIKKTKINNAQKSEAKTAVKAVREAITAKDKTKAIKLFPKAQSLLNKLAKKGILKKESAGRKTSRLAEQIHKLT